MNEPRADLRPLRLTATNEPPDVSPREISLMAVAGFLWSHRVIIGLCVVLGAVGLTGLSFLRHPKYRAEVVFSPVASSGSFASGLGGSLGGLAAIAGINLGGAGKQSEESLEYLRSREFTREFIERHRLMPLLFSGKWDAAHSRWRGDPPTIAEGVNRFSKQVTQIAEDRRTGIVTLAIIWRDRALAAQWANALIAEADAALRTRAIAEYGRSLEFLKDEAAHSDVVDVQTAVAKTMETELKDAMLARTRDAYAFKVLDPAVVRDPWDYDSPNRPLYAALGAGFGLLIGVILGGRRQRRARLRDRPGG
jgi:uncharacterized protein involved in exopolysaccharide biosynthesis